MATDGQSDKDINTGMDTPFTCGELLWELKLDDTILSDEASDIKPVEGTTDVLCSYNFDNRSGTIASIHVPGAPRTFEPSVNLPRTIDLRDRRMRWVNEHEQRAPLCLMEPLFQAMEVMSPDFQFKDLQVLTTDKALVYLLMYAQGSDVFVFLDAYAVRDTLVLLTKEPYEEFLNVDRHVRENLLQMGDHISNTDEHYRVVAYELGGIELAVLCEVDAALQCEELQQQNSRKIKPEPILQVPLYHDQRATQIICNGVDPMIPQEKVASFVFWDDHHMAKLFFRRISNVVEVYGGPSVSDNAPKPAADINAMRAISVASRLDEFRKSEATNLQKLTAYLNKIRYTARSQNGSPIRIAVGNEFGIRIHRVANDIIGVLPETIVAKYWAD
jgi:hypothetical protein